MQVCARQQEAEADSTVKAISPQDAQAIAVAMAAATQLRVLTTKDKMPNQAFPVHPRLT
jgi:hypothetical protein